MRRLSLLAPVLFLLAACGGGDGGATAETEVARDLEQIAARDTLVLLTTWNSTSYFVYRGEPMGLEYDLLRDFAQARDMELKVEVVRDRGEILDRLRRGEGDVAAARFRPARQDTASVAFTGALYQTQPALVQRGAEDPAAGPGTVRARLIGSPAELQGKRVFVPEDASYVASLLEVQDSAGDFEVVEVEGAASPEALIRRVAAGEIDLAAAPEDVAKLSASYYSNLAVTPSLGPPVDVAWAVRKSSPQLRAALDAFIAEKREDGTLEEMYEKYFVDRRGFRERAESEYLSSETGQLSPYDALFRQGAQALGWDWRLLASQAYQESRFDPTAESWAGAQGLLQLMPRTARAVGVSNSNDPAQNVQGATRFLGDLTTYWTERIPDPAQRLRFILASYNAGQGHVEDARRLAAARGGDPNQWEDVAYWLLQLSKRSVYTDPIVEHGFVRGMEPVQYVAVVLERFDHYRQFVRPGAEAAQPAA